MTSPKIRVPGKLVLAWKLLATHTWVSALDEKTKGVTETSVNDHAPWAQLLPRRLHHPPHLWSRRSQLGSGGGGAAVLSCKKIILY